MTDHVGFIGIGSMGRPMMERLAAAGRKVIVHDRNPDMTRGLPHVAADMDEIARSAEIVFLSLPTPAIVEQVAGEIAAAGGRVRTVVDLSTSGPDAAAKIARIFAAAGITAVDCPVSGGVSGAEAGTLALMVGAPDEALHAICPLLEQLGRIFHVGQEPGMGQRMKVINNLMSASALAVASEGVAMAVKGGLDAATVVDVLNAGSGRNSATLDKFPQQILTGTFDAGFSLGLMLKDVLLCMDQAHAMGLDLPVSEAVADTWRKAERTLGGDADFTRIVQIAEAEAGIEIRARPAGGSAARG